MAVENWQREAVTLRNQGLSYRAIADKLFNNTYYEYKIRAWLKTPEAQSLGYIRENDTRTLEGSRTVIAKSFDALRKENVNMIFFDLETSPCISYNFQHRDVFIRPEHKIKESHLLSISYAYNDGEVQGYRMTPEDVARGDDLTLVVNMIEAIEKADIMVGYNSKKFDIRYLNTRALYYGLKPITVTKHIDVYEQVRKSFSFPSKGMGAVSSYLGLEGKLANDGFDLWRRCMEYQNHDVCDKALQDMLTYNMQDIEATRDLYKKLNGWMRQIPNVGTMKNIKSGVKTLRCSKCASDDVLPLDKLTYTNTKGWEMYRCNSCGGVSRFSTTGLVGCPVS
jgi:uncharacterized protein YprB with RNaseH-like and TPR domain